MKSFYKQYGVNPKGCVLCIDQSNSQSYGDLQTWKDTCGFRHHAIQATAGNQPVINGAAGIAGTARTFDGTSDYMVCSDSNMNFTNEISIIAAIKLPVVTKNPYGVNTGYCPASKWLTTGDQRSYALMLCYAHNGGISMVTSSDGVNYDARSWNSGIAINIWYHIVCVRSGSIGKTYVNGVDLGNHDSHLGDFTSSIYQSTAETRVGSTELYATNTNLFRGSIALTQVFNRELSTGETQSSFNAIRQRFGK